MRDLICTSLAWMILVSLPFSLFGVLCRINRMYWSRTPAGISVAYVMIANGWGLVMFGTIDFVSHSTPLFWPLLMLGGLSLLASGNGLLFISDRRATCKTCPREGVRS